MLNCIEQEKLEGSVNSQFFNSIIQKMELNNRAMSENPQKDVNKIKTTAVQHLSGDLNKDRIASENTNKALLATSEIVPSHSNKF